jgi:hypothetical protein
LDGWHWAGYCKIGIQSVGIWPVGIRLVGIMPLYLLEKQIKLVHTKTLRLAVSSSSATEDIGSMVVRSNPARVYICRVVYF